MNPEQILQIVKLSASPEDLERRLSAAGIQVMFNRRESGEIYGWSLKQPESEYWEKASGVDRMLSWPNVKEELENPKDAQAEKTEADDFLASLTSHPNAAPVAQQLQEVDEFQEKMQAIGGLLRNVAEVSKKLAKLIAQLVNVILKLICRLFGLKSEALGQIDLERFEPVGVSAAPASQTEAVARKHALVHLGEIEQSILEGDTQLLPEVEGTEAERAAVVESVAELEQQNGQTQATEVTRKHRAPHEVEQDLKLARQRLTYSQAEASKFWLARAMGSSAQSPSAALRDRQIEGFLADPKNKNHKFNVLHSALARAERTLASLKKQPMPVGIFKSMARRDLEQKIGVARQDVAKLKKSFEELRDQRWTPAWLAQLDQRLTAEREAGEATAKAAYEDAQAAVTKLESELKLSSFIADAQQGGIAQGNQDKFRRGMDIPREGELH